MSPVKPCSSLREASLRQFQCGSVSFPPLPQGSSSFFYLSLSPPKPYPCLLASFLLSSCTFLFFLSLFIYSRLGLLSCLHTQRLCSKTFRQANMYADLKSSLLRCKYWDWRMKGKTGE